MTEASPEQKGREAGTRWALLMVLAVAQYAVLSFTFDAQTLKGDGRWASALSLVGELGPLAPAVVTALLVFGGAPLVGQLRLLGQTHAPLPLWTCLALNGAAYALFFAVTNHVFGSGQAPSGTLWPLLWLAGATAWGLTLLLVPLSPRAWWQWLSDNRALWLGGLALGVAAFIAGWAAGDLWKATSWWALYSVQWLLQWIEPQVVVVAETRLLGTPTFSIVVAPICSGYEGIGLITVFLGGFLIRYRDELHMRRALWVLPVGIVLAWVANVLRIAALVELGTHVSASAAVGGFHSKAGWIAFCFLALGFVLGMRRVDALWKPAALAQRREEEASSRNPVAPYLMPLMVLIATALLTGLLSAGFDRWYVARVAATAVALWLFRDVARVWQPRLSWEAIAAGVGVFVMWLYLAPSADAETTTAFVAELDAMGRGERMRWLFTRTVGTCITVPIAEELAFRGFMLRRLIDPDFEKVDFKRWTWLSMVVSCLAFGALHQGQWLAATLAGAAYAVTQIRTGRLGDAVTAHAITNALLSFYALVLGEWQWWA